MAKVSDQARAEYLCSKYVVELAELIVTFNQTDREIADAGYETLDKSCWFCSDWCKDTMTFSKPYGVSHRMGLQQVGNWEIVYEIPDGVDAKEFRFVSNHLQQHVSRMLG